MPTIDGLDALRTLLGQELGAGEWMAVTQERINAFAETTGDHQWIHVDPDRAARDTPFGTSIAHGFLTLSLVSTLLKAVVLVGGVRMSINYGLNRVRFVSPVHAGSRIRALASLGALCEVDGGVQATWNVTVEREGGEKPCLVAEWLVRYYR
jgi:acyl dehydratase